MSHRNCESAARSRGCEVKCGAFTLIELFVVMSVIIVLMGMAFPAFQSVQNSARKTQAKNDLVQIVTAVNAFYTEYGKYPLATADTVYGPAASLNSLLFNELRSVSPTQNSRQIVFMSPPDVKDPAKPRSGIGSSVPAGQLFDPWGLPYYVAIDGNYDNQITNPYSTNAGSTPLRAGVIAWSFGKDVQSQTSGVPADKNAGTNKDDVVSWQ